MATMNLCVSLTSGHDNPDNATMALVVANAATGCGKVTTLFLSSEGAWLAKRGEAEKITIGAPFLPARELMDTFLEAGGTMMVCGSCLKKRSILESELIDGCQPTGAAMLVELLCDNSASISF